MGKYHSNIGEHVKISGEFGETILAYCLAKEYLHVIVARSAGFDLVVKDTKGKIFPKSKTIAISVKTSKGKSWSKNLKKDYEIFKNYSKIWNYEPYFAFVTSKDIILFPAKLSKYKEVTTPKGSVSAPKLRNYKDSKSNKIIVFNFNIDSFKNK